MCCKVSFDESNTMTKPGLKQQMICFTLQALHLTSQDKITGSMCVCEHSRGVNEFQGNNLLLVSPK